MDWHQPFDRLDLDHNLALDHHIHAEATLEPSILVDDRDRNLTRESDTPLRQLVAQAFLIRRLEKPGSQSR